MLEDLVAAAVNDASHRVDQVSKDKMGGLAGGLNLPPDPPAYLYRRPTDCRRSKPSAIHGDRS